MLRASSNMLISAKKNKNLLSQKHPEFMSKSLWQKTA